MVSYTGEKKGKAMYLYFSKVFGYDYNSLGVHCLYQTTIRFQQCTGTD